jgi:hypothetical protein
MNKRVAFTAKPSAAHRPASPDEWVTSGTPSEVRAVSEAHGDVPLKRLTIDVPAPLHAQIKSKCALRGTKMADEIRVLLEQHFGPTAEAGE